jgi:hypothetical protein
MAGSALGFGKLVGDGKVVEEVTGVQDTKRPQMITKTIPKCFNGVSIGTWQIVKAQNFGINHFIKPDACWRPVL